MDTLSTDTVEKEENPPEHVGDAKPKTPFEHWLKKQYPQYPLSGLLASLELLEAHNPVPYIAFFHRDVTKGVKSSDLYRLLDSKREWDEIQKRQQHMLVEIQSQGKLTPELKQQIERSTDLDRLEDLYAPYKLKRQTLGVQARDAGLGALADYLWAKGHGQEVAEIPGSTLEDKAQTFAKPDSKFPDVASVLKGVQDILIEQIAESFELRSLVRSTVFRRSKIRSAKGSKAKPNSKYSKFFDYQEPIGSLKKSNASHRYFAMRKGWMEDELVLSFERPDEGILLEKFEEFACPQKDSVGAELLVQSARLALKGNVYTVMENEVHRHLKEEAEKHVIEVLAENLRKKLLRPGIGRKPVIGIDPGAANTPCSLALVDENGTKVLNLAFKLEELTDSMKQEFLQSLENLKMEAIAIAHGPRSKEVRDRFKTILAEAGKNLPIVTIHEHSASVYSSSPAAKEEFPDLDMNTRRAVFVARYLQDPLSALLVMDPKFFSLGEFQHDVNQGTLRAELARAMEFCVNFVGVDPNHAKPLLLSKVAGLDMELAKLVTQERQSSGPFKSRESLKKLAPLQALFDKFAGFLRFAKSEHALDCTFVHPKHYGALMDALAAKGITSPASVPADVLATLEKDAALAESFGPAIWENICYELAHFGQDPRGEFAANDFSPDLKSLADLKKDTVYPGVVTNVTSFGAFVDIGIEQDGLVHISELSDSYAKNPFDTLFPGDQVMVRVAGVNEEKKQISLTMKDGGGRRGERGRGRRPQRGNTQRGADRPQRRPRRAEGAGAGPGAEGMAAGPGQEQARDGQRPPRERRPRKNFARDGKPQDGKPEFKPREDKKPKKPQRDPKTGAVVKFDEEFGKTKGGPKVPSKVKPHTFNPFAGLANMLKEKQDKTE